MKFKQGDRLLRKNGGGVWFVIKVQYSPISTLNRYTYWIGNEHSQPAGKALTKSMCENNYDLIPDPNSILKELI